MAKVKIKQEGKLEENPIEAVRNIGRNFSDSVKNDVLKESARTFWEQLLTSKKTDSKERSQTSGELIEGEEISFNKKTEKEKTRIEAAIDYKSEIIHAERRIGNEHNQELSAKIQELIIELKKLTKSSKTLEIQFKEVNAQIAPINKPGKYHQNFFEWMLSVVKTARVRVESAEQWLKAVAGKGKKKDFWGLYKKHGTSFGLSGERAVSQQTG